MGENSGRQKSSNHRERRKQKTRFVVISRKVGQGCLPACPQAGSASHKVSRWDRQGMQFPRAVGAPAQGPRTLVHSLQKRLRNGQHPHRCAPCLAIAATPLFQGQESERTPCLHLLTDVYNAGHCGVGHQHLSIHKTELNTSGVLPTLEASGRQRMRRRQVRGGPICSVLGCAAEHLPHVPHTD